jgi:hypothetical protein
MENKQCESVQEPQEQTKHRAGKGAYGQRKPGNWGWSVCTFPRTCQPQCLQTMHFVLCKLSLNKKKVLWQVGSV